MGLYTPTSIPCGTYTLEETPAATLPKLTKMAQGNLEGTWGMRISKGIAVFLV